MPASRVLLLSALATLTAGCGAASVAGSQQQSSAAGAPAPSGTSSASAAGVVTRAHVDQATSTIVVDVSVTGPAQLQGGCLPTLAAHLVGPGGAVVSQPTPEGQVHCLAITEISIAAGQTQDFTTSIPAPAGHAAYTVQGTLSGGGDIPPVSVET